jgi:predicted amino acid racemase
MPVFDGVMPERVNMLRIGACCHTGPLDETKTVYGRKEMDVLHDDVFTLEAEVIEMNTKPTYPIGKLGVAASGKKVKYVDRGSRRRALLAIGTADYGDIYNIIPQLEGSSVTMASGDHTILDIEDSPREWKVGDIVEFEINYASLVFLTNTRNVHIVYK